MHKEILTDEQVALLPTVQHFNKDFGLVGGTAIALHIGHRRSIDFDLFGSEEFNNLSLKGKIKRKKKIDTVIVDKEGEFTIKLNGVQFTFFHFPYSIPYTEHFLDVIRMPDLITLAAMKAFALGGRAKWKDYIDLYFIMKDFFSFKEIAQKGEELFGGEFNQKLFRIQLSYYEDVNYDEAVEFLPGFEVDDEVVKKELIKYSLE